MQHCGRALARGWAPSAQAHLHHLPRLSQRLHHQAMQTSIVQAADVLLMCNLNARWYVGA
jgi:hypothetical protein